jgi:hypothetical protein
MDSKSAKRVVSSPFEKGDSVISFDRMLPTERGFVSGVVLKPCVPTLVTENTFPQNAAAIALERGRRITLSEAHSLLGHAAISVTTDEVDQ